MGKKHEAGSLASFIELTTEEFVWFLLFWPTICVPLIWKGPGWASVAGQVLLAVYGVAMVYYVAGVRQMITLKEFKLAGTIALGVAGISLLVCGILCSTEVLQCTHGAVDGVTAGYIMIGVFSGICVCACICLFCAIFFNGDD
mmetsp:Transcript_21473/g.42631  ORF Transcript_21473/g.42631 Transcript_21473/m.42631 type:complete len:143 (-) Transcript_21473:426-854(-)